MATKPLPDLPYSQESWTKSRKRHHSDISTLAGGQEQTRENLTLQEDGLSEEISAYSGNKNHPGAMSNIPSTSSSKRLKASLPLEDMDSPDLDPYHDPRSSRFQEGSMNDRVSTKPPSIYAKDSSTFDNYMADEQLKANLRDILHAPTRSSASQTTNESFASRGSGIFRLGKALASAFTPLTKWKADAWKISQEVNQDVFNERQEKAEKAYAELKKSGYLPAMVKSKTYCNIDMDTPAPARLYTYTTNSTQTRPPRDSGVDVGETDISKLATIDDIQYTTEDQSTDDAFIKGPKMFADCNTLRATPSLAGLGRTDSPSSSEVNHAPRRSFHFHTPSLQNLRKVKSRFQIISRKSEAEDSPSLVPQVQDGGATRKTLTKALSSRDLKRQVKLTKKVSNLEAKLEAARRELQSIAGVSDEANDDVPPLPPLPDQFKPMGRKPFKPGALPSLPSESLLDQHLREAGVQDTLKQDEVQEESQLSGNTEQPKEEPIKELLAINQSIKVKTAQAIEISPVKSEVKVIETGKALPKATEERIDSPFPERDSSLEPPLEVSSKPARKTLKKRKSSSGFDDDVRYNLHRTTEHDGKTLNPKKTMTIKKRRPVPKVPKNNSNSPNGKSKDHHTTKWLSSSESHDDVFTETQSQQQPRKIPKRDGDTSPGSAAAVAVQQKQVILSPINSNYNHVPHQSRVVSPCNAHYPKMRADHDEYTVSPLKDHNVPPMPAIPEELKANMSPVRAQPKFEIQTRKPVVVDPDFEWPDDVF
ncbi:MAG: hypothetical protein M1834_007036 [Cirrosporium novae-zelandiae]|nr:MAG: hypothetical protein M1834_007036 [Cirrosporium novae-zelandiae]